MHGDSGDQSSAPPQISSSPIATQFWRLRKPDLRCYFPGKSGQKAVQFFQARPAARAFRMNEHDQRIKRGVARNVSHRRPRVRRHASASAYTLVMQNDAEAAGRGQQPQDNSITPQMPSFCHSYSRIKQTPCQQDPNANFQWCEASIRRFLSSYPLFLGDPGRNGPELEHRFWTR